MNQSAFDAMAAQLKTLEQECAVLKRQARFQRRAGALALVGIALLALAGARRADDKIMDVGGLVVRDKDGKARIILEIANGEPSLRFHDKAGMPRAMMGLGGDPFPTEHPYLSLLTANCTGGLRMGVGMGPFNPGEPHLTMSDEDHAPQILLGLDFLPPNKGKPFLFLKDQKGKPLFQAPQP